MAGSFPQAGGSDEEGQRLVTAKRVNDDATGRLSMTAAYPQSLPRSTTPLPNWLFDARPCLPLAGIKSTCSDARKTASIPFTASGIGFSGFRPKILGKQSESFSRRLVVDGFMADFPSGILTSPLSEIGSHISAGPKRFCKAEK